MVDFAAWVADKMWLALLQQSDVVTLEMNEALHRSGFNMDFLAHPEDWHPETFAGFPGLDP